MEVIIIGTNRAEFCQIRRGDVEKHFFKTRGQLYMTMPDGLTKCINTRFGRYDGEEEVIIFSENSSIPYDTGKHVCYDEDYILGNIDLEKNLKDKSLLSGRNDIFSVKARSFWKTIKPYLSLIITGAVIGLALLINNSGGSA